MIYKLKGNYSEKLKLLLLSFIEYKTLALPVEIAKIYNSIGTVYYYQADYLNARKQFAQAHNIYKKIKEWKS